MNEEQIGGIIEYIKELPDPRGRQGKLHKLSDIVVIAVCAVICGADDWDEIADYGQRKQALLKRFLALPNGIPSHDTFNRVLSRLDPEAWQQCFMQWVQDLAVSGAGQVVAIDGKSLRASRDESSNTSALHLVSAWASESQIVLGQCAVDGKRNEITAIPKLLERLVLAGSVVTIDAMGCQKGITRSISQAEADYVIALKANQGALFEDVQWLFSYAEQEQLAVDSRETFDVAHGRYETRRCSVIHELSYLDTRGWTELKGVIKIEHHTEHPASGTCSNETRYYLSSLSCSAAEALRLVRSHWSTENVQHWILDVAFQEDRPRIRKDYAPQDMALLRRLALNLLKQDTSLKAGIKRKRFNAALDDSYLLSLLNNAV